MRATEVLLHAQDLQAVVVADGDPVGLRGGPLHVVDLPFRSVGQDGVFDGARHLLDVPDQGLMVVGCKNKRVTSENNNGESLRQKQKEKNSTRKMG